MSHPSNGKPADNTKRFADYDAQIAHLISKGLLIDDKPYALRMLRELGYFALISGYRTIFYTDDDRRYKPGTTFKNIVDLYNVDHELRSIFLEYILHIERHLKSIASYAFLSRFGDGQEAYLTAENYSPERPRDVHRLIDLLRSILAARGKYRYIDHYLAARRPVPLWSAINALTMGSMIKFVECAAPPVLHEICSAFPELTAETLPPLLSAVYAIRNCCAHNEWLYDLRLRDPIPDLKLHMLLQIPRDETGYLSGTADLFAGVIALKYLLSAERFVDFKDELIAVLDHYPKENTTFSHDELMGLMGFPEGWREL